MIVKALQTIDEIASFEYGFLLENTDLNANSFKLHIPKIMPLIKQEDPKHVSKGLRSDIFVNAAECRPKVSATIMTRNYLDVPILSGFTQPKPVIQFTSNTSDGTPWPFPRSRFNKGARVICMSVNNNINDLYITNIPDSGFTIEYKPVEIS